MRLAGHTIQTGRLKMCNKFQFKTRWEKAIWDSKWRIILRWILNRCEGVKRTDMAHDRIKTYQKILALKLYVSNSVKYEYSVLRITGFLPFAHCQELNN
jgi:hypothetical protein